VSIAPYIRFWEVLNTLALNVSPFRDASRYEKETETRVPIDLNFFSVWGENTLTLVYDKKGILQCASCHSHTFDLVLEQRVSSVSRNGKDPIANRDIESERIVSIVCARCGAPQNEQNNILRQ